MATSSSGGTVASDRVAKARGRVTAVLGPTNTGKTHIAVERMLQYPTGVIGLPLRLLAREVYGRIVEKVAADSVALITGEEKIKPRNARYWVCTVEAMPRDLDVDFVAIDEIQLAADLDRGHVFTDRLLNRRGREETWIIGAATMRDIIERIAPDAPVVTRPRLSTLSFAGDRKISRLPPRTAIVAFSAEEVYAIAEFIRRQRGGAAVVLGALSPRTRNAQVELYQSGDVDFIVATDAIGMGLNLDVDHIAFAAERKFDGWQHRRLTPAEFGQIAGRAGRHIKDGTFGTTGRCLPFDDELIEAIETHRFDSVTMLQWRNTNLDFSSIGSLQATLETQPDHEALTRAPLAEDVLALDLLAHDDDIRRQAKTAADVQRLWDVCQIPDYRKLSLAAHADLATTLFGFIVRAGRVPDDWFARQIAGLDRVDGEIDALSQRIAQTRTLNYIANRPDWLGDPEHWQGVTRQVEDSLSDALHERLAHRFIDRRTSVLRRRLRENAMLEAEVMSSGDVVVEGLHVGALHGFRFTSDPNAAGAEARTLNAAAQKALAAEMENRANRVAEAVDEAFVLARDGAIRWLGEIVAKIVAGDHVLRPRAQILADDQLTGPALERARARIDLWLAQHVKKLLGPVADLEAPESLDGIARGVAFQIGEALGVLERAKVANDVKSLDQNARSALRKLGVRFGAYHLFLPQTLKTGPRALATQLWTLAKGGPETVPGYDDVAHLASSGRTSFPVVAQAPRELYLVAGYRVCGERAVRVDILERLADIIRPAIAYRPGVSVGAPPPGSADGDGFVVTGAMTSLAGCAGEAFASILKSLGYECSQRPGPAITVPLIKAAPTEPARPAEAASPEAVAPGSEEAPPALAQDAADETEAAANTAEAGEIEVAAALVEEATAVAPEPEAAIGAPADSEPAADVESAGEAAPALEAAPDAGEALAGDAATVQAEASVAAAGEAPAPAPVEPAMIEVWRPARRHAPRQGRPDQRQKFNRGRRQERPPVATTGPEAAAAPPADGTAPAGAAKPEQGRERFNRPGRRPDDKRPGNGGGWQGRAPGQERRRDEKPGGERDERPRGPRPEGGDKFRGPRPNRDGRPFATTEQRAEGRNRAPDPNSPFAKLLALKAELEKKTRKE